MHPVRLPLHSALQAGTRHPLCACAAHMHTDNAPVTCVEPAMYTQPSTQCCHSFAVLDSGVAGAVIHEYGRRSPIAHTTSACCLLSLALLHQHSCRCQRCILNVAYLQRATAVLTCVYMQCMCLFRFNHCQYDDTQFDCSTVLSSRQIAVPQYTPTSGTASAVSEPSLDLLNSTW